MNIKFCAIILASILLMGPAAVFYIGPYVAPGFLLKYGPTATLAIRCLVIGEHVTPQWNDRIARGNSNDEEGFIGILSSSRDSRYRFISADALGSMKSTRAFDLLIDKLQLDENFQVRYTCARSLAEIGDTKAVPFLITAIDDPDASVRNIAVDALGIMKAREAEEAIRNAMIKYPYPSMEYSANKALESIRLANP